MTEYINRGLRFPSYGPGPPPPSRTGDGAPRLYSLGGLLSQAFRRNLVADGVGPRDFAGGWHGVHVCFWGYCLDGDIPQSTGLPQVDRVATQGWNITNLGNKSLRLFDVGRGAKI